MGPLTGVRVIEMAGIGPAPFCGMLLADLGADVIRVERAMAKAGAPAVNDPHLRNRRSIALDLKRPPASDALLRLIERCDVLLEGLRPGVAESLGFGPEVSLARNSRLIYGRMTGWGQDGPLARAAGHDLNYIALSGALHAIGPGGGKPVPPLNLIGDFGGGGMMLAFGVVAALLERERSGMGQIIDAAMVDGVASLMSAFWNYREIGYFENEEPGASPLAGSLHYYNTYETSDGKYISIAPIEPRFYAELVERMGLNPEDVRPHFDDEAEQERLKDKLAAVFRKKTRDEWCALLEGTDACFAPVLSFSEVAYHPHNRARESYIQVGEHIQNAPVPRFSRTAPAPPRPAGPAGGDTRAVLTEFGFSVKEIDRICPSGRTPET